jgi:hypothetical protein
LASADFNSDGNRDLLIGNQTNASGEAVVVFGNGLGGFGSPKQIFIIGGMTDTVAAVATGDMNGDNKADLIILTSLMGYGFISVLQGDGTGNFTFVTSAATGGIFPSSVGVADLNADGKLDLIVTNGESGSGNGTVATLLGDGTGHLGSANVFPVGNLPVALALSDLNGDGKTDVAVANQGSDDATILFGDGMGNLGSPNTIPNVGDAPQSVVKGDFDGDGKIDLILVSSTPDTATLFLNDGNGAFSPVANFAFGAPSPLILGQAIDAIDGDFNLDTKPDLVVVHELSRKGSVHSL